MGVGSRVGGSQDERGVKWRRVNTGSLLKNMLLLVKLKHNPGSPVEVTDQCV